ncbi:carbohydrate kinase [Thalassotalea sp. PP2-459]|uniref:carbohydrate kinase family protein n=1 Tax=Thalassotalea sp. PP2-459 TaxID=1742724 RepID=UPI000945A1DE|nr:carbohydrate kinase [Thalassotalea sp. PP2-459]OKY25263.1 hypothetical protein BI291_17030 [Thalassotalea sp. PP2-459]
MLSLLSYGEVLVDFLPSSSNTLAYTPLAGGAPANVAVAFAKLGAPSYFAGGISEDCFGSMLMKQLEHEGVNTTFVKRVKDANTALVLVSLDNSGERTFNFYRHNTADTKYGRTQVNEINWQGIGIFHYCSNTLTEESLYEDTLYALKRAKENQVLISFDVNLRQQLWHELTLLPERVEACIKQSDIIKLSREEAEYLAQAKLVNVNSYIDHILSLGAKLIVITDGENAVQAISLKESLTINVPKISPVDTTGAGDSFISGFLFHLVHSVKNDKGTETLFDAIKQIDGVKRAVSFGTKCGAFTCQKKGAFIALPKITDLNTL